MRRSKPKGSRSRKRRNQRPFDRHNPPPGGQPEPPRTEGDVFAELASLCTSPGYIHALSYVIYRDTVVTAGEEFTKEDFLKLYERERLIRTELAVLIGLWLKGDRSLKIPEPSQIQDMIDRTDILCAELHTSMLAPARDDFIAALELRQSAQTAESPLGKAAAMREAIFYSGESAFTFQYSQLARERYASDAEWLQRNRGFDIGAASEFFEKLISHLSDNIPDRIHKLSARPMSEWTMLPIFCFTEEEATEISGLDVDVVRSIIEAFSVPRTSTNTSFQSLFTFNDAAVYPFISLENGSIAFLLEYVGTEGLYNSPSYWMRNDPTYASIASKHRGEFAERISFEFVKRVFPEPQIYRNVLFKPSKTVTAGEADLILVHGKRAFVFQLKSKGLTELARTGDELAISRDFTAAIQHAYDQAITCIDLLKSGVPTYKDGKPLKIANVEAVEEFYPVCITSENYPSLSFQVGQFLKKGAGGGINEPIVLDLFTFDAITEFLRTPLYFVDYLAKRSALFDKVLASHELVLLSYHLRGNLYVPKDVHLLLIEDDFMVELDIAMAVRRRGLPGARTPSGILTRDLDNPLGRILIVADESDRPEVHQLGELVLNLSSKAWNTINRWIDHIARQSRQDGRNHDVTVPLTEDGIGLTVHCNDNPDDGAFKHLASHCEIRKYIHKARRWFGVCVSPETQEIRFAVGRVGAWRFVPELEEEAASLRVRSVPHWVGESGQRLKLGRNDSCPCGSGKKYKKCCLGK